MNGSLRGVAYCITEMQRTKEEEMKKLKAIAVKLKKELGEAREKVNGGGGGVE